jgi:hypothetical protein
VIINTPEPYRLLLTRQAIFITEMILPSFKLPKRSDAELREFRAAVDQKWNDSALQMQGCNDEIARTARKMFGWASLTALPDHEAAALMGVNTAQAAVELRKARNREAWMSTLEDTVSNFHHSAFAPKSSTTMTYK